MKQMQQQEKVRYYADVRIFVTEVIQLICHLLLILLVF